jgi:hypothetical protein
MPKGQRPFGGAPSWRRYCGPASAGPFSVLCIGESLCWRQSKTNMSHPCPQHAAAPRAVKAIRLPQELRAVPWSHRGCHSHRALVRAHGLSLDALHRICDRLTFTAGLSTGILPYHRDGLIRRGMHLGQRQVVDADLRIYVQEVRAVHPAAADGGMRVAVRLPGMRRERAPCPPNCAKLPQHVGRSAPGRRKVRAQHRRIARGAAILARSCWNDQEVENCPEAETCTGEGVSARLTDLISRRETQRTSLRSPGCMQCQDDSSNVVLLSGYRTPRYLTFKQAPNWAAKAA